MIVTINQFSKLARDQQGNYVPLGAGVSGNQTLTAAGAATALNAGTKVVRIATDTAIKIDVFGASTDAYMPAGTSEYFAAWGSQVITVTAA